MFWIKAAPLLNPHGQVVRVGFESGPKGLDDIWVEYDPQSKVQDQFGKQIDIERFQCKWHVNLGTFTHRQLTEPSYIGRKSKSLLQLARGALAADTNAGRHSLVYLTTNHRVDAADPLLKKCLISTSRHTLNLDRLFDGTQDNSATGQVRKCWREHLGMDDVELRQFCARLGFELVADSLDGLKRRMADRLANSGLTALEPGGATHYDAMPWAWAQQGRKVFDRSSFRQACIGDGLLANTALKPLPMFGIKSFERAYDRLEDRCTDTLDLIPHFEDRFIRNPADWHQTLLPKLKHFIEQAVHKTPPGDRMRLALEAHATLAFAAGSVLNTKVRRTVELEQNSPGPALWAPDDRGSDPDWPAWDFQTCHLGNEGADFVVAVGLTQVVEPKVRAYVQAHLPEAATLLVATPSGGSGQQSVACGAHADQLAQSLATRIKTMRETANMSRTHLFIAAPNAFTFYLGRHFEVMKPLTLYEFDFQSQRDGGYEPALALD